jgi:hypothetical protein
MDSQPSFDYYLTFLQSGVETLESYLLSDDLFWSLGVASPTGQSYPMLTLGELLLFAKCAQTLAQSSEQDVAYRKAETQLEMQRTRWRTAWERKAAKEFQSRLRQWGERVEEIRRDPAENAPYYHTEVRLRTFLELLKPDAAEVDPAYLEHLHSLDLILEALFSPGDFIWHPDLAPAFPKGEFWFLWGKPRA